MDESVAANAGNPLAGIIEAMSAWARSAPGMQALTSDPLGLASGRPLPSMAEALMGRVDAGPTLAPLWDFDRKAARASAAWWRVQEATARYRQLVDGVWPTVQQAVLHRQVAASDVKFDDLKAVTELWLEELNRALLELMRTPEYLTAQRATLTAGLGLRETLGEISEELCEWLQIPARSEVDDLSRTVTELRRELRALQRTLRPSCAPPAPVAEPRRKPKAKPSATPSAARRRIA